MCRGAAVILAVLWLALPAHAERRVALLVAHPFGGAGLEPLRYTANDVERMREVLTLLGSFSADDVLISFGESADEVAERFAEATERLANSDGKTFFLFYYSGHAKDGDLRLGDTLLSLTETKRLTEATGADMRVAFFDSCRSGSVTQLKGATKGAPITLAIEDSLAHEGQVMVAASSADEDAQESDAIQGSFFTYYLTGGLRGMADKNGDGNVTLSEAYSHTYAYTVARTLGTRGGVQHPTYQFDLRGAGDVVVTRPSQPTSRIVLPTAEAGHFVVFDTVREILVAELDKSDGRETQVAVRPGRYVVKKRLRDHLLMQELQVAEGATVAMQPSAMRRVELSDDFAKGKTITANEVRYGRIGVRLSLVAGPQAFLSAPARAEYFPTMTLVGLRLDLPNLVRRHIGLRLDLAMGSSGEQSLTLSDTHVGDLHHRVSVSELTSGISAAANLPLTGWLEAEAGMRLGFIFLTRKFSSGALPSQVFSTLTPGLEGGLTFHLTSWLRAGLNARVHYMFFNMDESQSLAFVDGGLLLMTVFR
jgi:hypothetical protein